MSSTFKNPTTRWTIESLSTFVSEIVMKESGNVLGADQQSMVVSRLRKRLIDLGDVTPDDYFNYFDSNYQKEISLLITILTTHHTFFFREFSHFEFVLKNMKTIIERVRARGERNIRILSAACSRGHEVYSLATFLETHLKDYPGISYEIWASDIDPESVKIAKNGVYTYKEVKTIPQIYLSGYWQRGKGDIAHFAKIKTFIKERCKFGVMNLKNMDSFIRGERFDIIFCRNVFIYFNPMDIGTIVKKFKDHLYPGAYFITGLSESLKVIELEKQTHAPSVYSFSDFGDAKEKKLIVLPAKELAPTSFIPSPIRVLAVDDSSAVIKLLTKIFENDSDFELVGTAKNGKEAEEFLKMNKVDAMTLDIHMPEMDGVEYLKKNFSKGHPHVVMVSSASREDCRYAQEALKSGARDFVEKPALNNLSERAEEIKIKIKMSFINNQSSSVSSIDQSFKRDFVIKNHENKARVYFASYSDMKKIGAILEEMSKSVEPPTFIFFEGSGNLLDMIKGELKGKCNVHVHDNDTVPKINNIYLCDFKDSQEKISNYLANKKVSVSVFGIGSQKAITWISNLVHPQLLLEDIPKLNEDLREIATDIFPWTSFLHIATEFLAKDD